MTAFISNLLLGLSRNLEFIFIYSRLGMYDAIRIADINVNYGRMTPLGQSVMEDNGASATGSESVNMESAFGSADNYSTRLAWVSISSSHILWFLKIRPPPPKKSGWEGG